MPYLSLLILRRKVVAHKFWIERGQPPTILYTFWRHITELILPYPVSISPLYFYIHASPVAIHPHVCQKENKEKVQKPTLRSRHSMSSRTDHCSLLICLLFEFGPQIHANSMALRIKGYGCTAKLVSSPSSLILSSLFTTSGRP